MNEKMKQLAEQAGATVITTHGMEHVVDGCYVIGPARLEKFAELIVKAVFDRIADERFEVYAPVVKNVKQHFGVK